MLVLPSTVTHLSQKCCFWKGNWQKHPSSSSISLSVTQSHLLIEFQTEAQRQRWNGTLNYVSCENRWTFTQCWPRQFTSKSGTHTHKTHLHGIPEKTEPLNLRLAVILQRGWLKRVKEEEEGRENRKREENNQRGSRGGHRWLQGRSCKGGPTAGPMASEQCKYSSPGLSPQEAAGSAVPPGSSSEHGGAEGVMNLRRFEQHCPASIVVLLTCRRHKETDSIMQTKYRESTMKNSKRLNRGELMMKCSLL